MSKKLLSLSLFVLMALAACAPLGIPNTGAQITTAPTDSAPAAAPTGLPEPTSVPTERTGPTAAPTEASAQPSVSVDDGQEIEHGQLVVAEVVSPGPGWIVIHADNGGAPGPVIGFAAVSEGANQDVAVEVDEAQATATLYAMLHMDAGEVGTYEFPGADSPVMINGQMVSPAFQVDLRGGEDDAPAPTSAPSNGGSDSDYDYGDDGY